ncbi:hypothetical protein C8R46DRAFT_1037919 [Mycena filopes]|nr:hypothetical protein C8R46DRAFT_1037919 [Mycena filopes]
MSGDTIDTSLALPLQLRQEQLQYLKSEWAPALQPSVEIRPTQEATVTNVPRLKPIVAHAARRPHSLPPTVILQPYELEDELVEVRDSSSASPDDMMVSAEELDTGAISDLEEPLSVQDMLANDDDEEESTIVDADSLNVDIHWETEVQLQISLASTTFSFAVLFSAV